MVYRKNEAKARLLEIIRSNIKPELSINISQKHTLLYLYQKSRVKIINLEKQTFSQSFLKKTTSNAFIR